MKPSKMRIAHRMIKEYDELVQAAYNSYSNFQETEGEDRNYWAARTLGFAHRANTIYDCAFMVEIKGLVDCMNEVQAMKRGSILSGYTGLTKMDDLVDEMNKYIEEGGE